MSSQAILNVFLLVLSIFLFFNIVMAVVFYVDIKNCEKNQSPYCFSYICPDQTAAVRLADAGPSCASLVPPC